MKRISAFPIPRLSALAVPGRPFRKTLNSYSGVYSSGRAAIYRALQALRLPRSTTVWFPAFHCGVEIEAAMALGLRPAFYRVNGRLEIDVDDLDQNLRRAGGPVLAIHYYGFPQPCIAQVAALCERYGAPLIEDCAHALFSRYGGRELGSFAPLAIFSLRKTLPLHDGGALVANGSGLEIRRRGAFSWEAYRVYVKSAVRGALGDSVAAAYRRLRWGAPGDTAEPAPPAPATVDHAVWEAGISAISRRLAQGADPVRIVEARRRNWTALDSLLAGVGEGYEPVYAGLPDGVCPLFLPVRAARRADLMQELRHRGVETFVFGAVPHPLLSPVLARETAKFRDEILCLPLHQEIPPGAIESIASAFAAALQCRRAARAT